MYHVEYSGKKSNTVLVLSVFVFGNKSTLIVDVSCMWVKDSMETISHVHRHLGSAQLFKCLCIQNQEECSFILPREDNWDYPEVRLSLQLEWCQQAIIYEAEMFLSHPRMKNLSLTQRQTHRHTHSVNMSLDQQLRYLLSIIQPHYKCILIKCWNNTVDLKI